MSTLLLCGSISSKSHTRALLDAFQEEAVVAGHHTVFWDLREKPLPIAIPEYHWKVHETPSDSVREFADIVRSASAFALGTPLYHGSMSGVLKNALDHLWYDAFRNKPVALLSHGSSIRRCSQPCEHLQTVVRTLYGYGLQTQVATTKEDFSEDGDRYVVASAEIRERLRRQAKELMQMASMLEDNNIEKED